MNSINITGRLTKDMEIKESKNGRQFLRYAIAFDVGFKDNKKTVFKNCMQWNFSEKYLAKQGDLIAITGQLDEWQTNNNKIPFILVFSMDILRKKESATESATENVKKAFNGVEVTDKNPFSDDDIPF